MNRTNSFIRDRRINPVHRVSAAWLVMLLVLTCWLALPRLAHAAPAAGTQIGNQASATYTDASQTSRTVTSNAVVTTVQQVAALTLTADGARSVSPGGQVAYPHTLTNTGNGSDTVALTSLQSGSFGFSTVTFYADANGDGVADNATPITSSGALAAGAAFRFVAVGTVPGSATSGQNNSLVVTATSGFSTAIKASNTDTTTVSTNAVISVTKAIDVGSGAPGSGPRTYTLTYTNTGNSAAQNLSLTDVVPSGMSYVPASGRWSVSGGTVLSDGKAASDDQGGIRYDYNVTQPTQVTAVITSVAPGVTGTLSFQVMVKAGLPPGGNPATANTARYTYNDGSANIGPYTTNTAQFVVTQGAGVTLAGATVASSAQGGTVKFNNALTNTGNGVDSFDMSVATSGFPAGTSVSFYQADGVTPMLDTNGNGIPDTGPIQPGASTTVVVQVQLPPSATGGPYSLQKKAQSKADLAQSATATDTLTVITGSRVDLTNNSSGTGAPGSGAGPEAQAVVSNSTAPGSATRFTYQVANGSSVADSFDLKASTDSSFATAALPSGWTLVFRDASGAVITGTGVINAGQVKQVFADVTVPAGAAPVTQDFFVRALSPTSGASDRIHDAVAVTTVRSLALAPNGSGQIYAGGSVVYSHTITNTGNVLEGDGTGSQVALALTHSAAGFSAITYWDKNNNGVLDADDPVVGNLAALSGGSNGASTAAGLAPGESATLFVKVYAPGSGAPGTQDTTTLTATTSGSVNGAAAPSAVSVTDTTVVIAGEVSLTKTQAVDVACSGVSDDAAYGAANIAAAPGACVSYRLVVKNVGIANVTGVIVSDATPANTRYNAATPASTTLGTVSAPADGSAGTVQATVGTLAPGQQAVVRFSVRINP
jgi:trimeric autotransporter adhesin